jgi:hypothetical protein
VTAFTAFYDKVVSQVPGCEPAYALSFIRDAAIEFLQRSRTWRVTLTPFTVKWAAVTGVSAANPAVVTATGHPFSAGERVLIPNASGMTELNGFVYTITNPTANTFELTGINSTLFTTFQGTADAAQAEIPISSPSADADIAEILGGETNEGTALTVTSPTELDERFGKSWVGAIGAPRWCYLADESALLVRLVPAPDRIYRNYAVLRAALKPKQDATQMPDALYARYREDVEIGALAKLFSQLGKPWANSRRASELAEDFTVRLNRARYRAARGNTQAPITSPPQDFEAATW